MSLQGQQSSGAQELCSAQPSAPPAGTSTNFLSCLISACVSAKNAESVGRPCLRNDHISGVVFLVSPPRVTAELGLAQVNFAVCDALHRVFLLLDQMAAWCFSKLECYLGSKYEIKMHMENSSLLGLHC